MVGFYRSYIHRYMPARVFNGRVLIELASSVGTSGCLRVEFPPRRLFLGPYTNMCICIYIDIGIYDNTL